MEISLTDIPDLISVIFVFVVLLLMLAGVTAPEYISSGVAAILVAEVVDFWTRRQATRLSEIEKEAIQTLRNEGSEAGYEEFERLLNPIVARYTVSDLLESLKNKKVIKELREDGSRRVKLRFRARVL